MACWERLKRSQANARLKLRLVILAKCTILQTASEPSPRKRWQVFMLMGQAVCRNVILSTPLKINRGKYIKMAGKGITSAIRGRITPNQIWHLVGKRVVKDIQYYIAEGKFTPIAESTAKRKGTRVPLMETLQLHDK